MKSRYCRSVNGKGAGRPLLTHHHKGWWNETKWLRWVWRNGGMEFVIGENGRNPAKNLPRPRFVHYETHMEWPRRELGTPAVGGERLTACATRPPMKWIENANLRKNNQCTNTAPLGLLIYLFRPIKWKSYRPSYSMIEINYCSMLWDLFTLRVLLRMKHPDRMSRVSR